MKPSERINELINQTLSEYPVNAIFGHEVLAPTIIKYLDEQYETQQALSQEVEKISKFLNME
jgi:hypothetical protein